MLRRAFLEASAAPRGNTQGKFRQMLLLSPLLSLLFLQVFWVLVLPGCQTSFAKEEGSSPPLVVFSAMSLKEPIEKLSVRFERLTGQAVVTQFGGSNLLAHQIEATHRQDVFLSADSRWMEHLSSRGLVAAEGQGVLVENRLVAVARKDAEFQPRTLSELVSPRLSHIAIGDPRGVPAGRYAKHALQEASLWSALSDKMTPGSNVRVALSAAASDPRTVAFVYRTDVARDPSVHELFEVSRELTGAIEVHVGALERSSKGPRPEALRFVRFLRSPESLEVFSRYGFEVPSWAK